MNKHRMLMGTTALALALGAGLGAGAPAEAASGPPKYRTTAGIGASSGIAGLSVTDFGAVANDGRDDYAAFAAAAQAAKQQKKTLYIPAGQYELSHVLTIDSIRMEGAGKASTVLISTDPNNGSIDLVGSGVQIRKLKHAYRTTVPRGDGAHEKNSITVRGATNFVIDSVLINKASTAGIMVAYDSSKGTISNNTVVGTNADGIHMTTGSHGIAVKNNNIKAVGDDGIAVVSYKTSPLPTRDITISGNIVGSYSKARGIAVVGGNNVVIQSNNVKDTMMAGLYIGVEAAYDTMNVDGVQVKNNKINHTGIKEPESHPNVLVFAGQGSIDNVRFTGNTITNGAHRGIGVWGEGVVRSVTFEGNTLVNPNGADTTFKNGKIKLVDNVGF